MSDEELFDEVSKDIIDIIDTKKYQDKDKELYRLNILRNMLRFLESYDVYVDNINILNENAKNGKRRILDDRL